MLVNQNVESMSDDISNFGINKSNTYKITYIITNIFLLFSFVSSFIILGMYKRNISIILYTEEEQMQTNIFCFAICLVIQIFILISFLSNSIIDKDFDFRKRFYSDDYYYLPCQNILYSLNLITGILYNFMYEENDEIRLPFDYAFLIINLFLMLLSLLIFRKNEDSINISFYSRVCFTFQCAINLSISTYLSLYSLFRTLRNQFQIDEFESEMLIIFLYCVYGLVAFVLLAKKDISFPFIMMLILSGCLINCYENKYEKDTDEIIALYIISSLVFLSTIYISFIHRKEIFKLEKSENENDLI